MAVATLAEVASATGLRRLRAPRRGDRHLPLGVHVRRRPPDAQLARRPGPAPGRRRRLRLARRGVSPPLRVDRAPWRERARHGGATNCCALLGRRVGRLLHDRRRRRGAGGPAQGVPRRRAAGDELDRRHRPPPRQCAGRRPRSTTPWTAPSPWPDRSSNATRPRWPIGGALPMWRGRYEIVVTGDRPDLLAEVRRRWLPAAVMAWGQPDDGPLFAGRPPSPAGPTSARLAPAGCPPRTPLPWPANWRLSSYERRRPSQLDGTVRTAKTEDEQAGTDARTSRTGPPGSTQLRRRRHRASAAA